MSRVEHAKEYFKQGYNCAQAVALAFVDETGISFESLAKIAQPFGGGLGRLRLTCGAVSGMSVVLGLLFGQSDAQSKTEIYPIVQELCAKFKEENGSLLCAELLSSGNKRPCIEFVATCTQLLEDLIQEHKGE